MGNITKISLAILITFLLLFLATHEKNSSEYSEFGRKLVVGLESTYPPFEFKRDGLLMGFDVDLAKALAKELGREATFVEMQFGSLIPAVNAKQVDVIISGVTITPEREKNISFSTPYLFDDLAVVYLKDAKYTTKDMLKGKAVGVELGTTMQIWAKENVAGVKLQTLSSNVQAVEALSSGHVDAVIIDQSQAVSFCKQKPNLGYSVIDKASHGYGVGMSKDSSLLGDLNKALANLERKGEIERLKKAWLSVTS